MEAQKTNSTANLRAILAAVIYGATSIFAIEHVLYNQSDVV
jgi:hypothetical protein